ncbi:MAG: hypothetical protein ACTHNG_13345 [Ginsengibacter sp.]|jgi:hypothetical protein
MKTLLAFVLFFFVLSSCKQKVLSGVALENKLKETMKNYLDTTMLAGTKITVKDVAFYPEASKKLYNCRFHVRVQYNNHDTTGIVAASITNDFKTVDRTQ